MKKPSFRSRLQQGETLLGTVISLASPEIGEIMADAGFDWLFVDMEHSTLDASAAQAILQAVGGQADCILRVPLNDEIWIKKALDTGCAGVMVPQVNTPADAQRAVRLSKYPPLGSRSVGVARAHGYGAYLKEYLDEANENTAVIIQAEHIDAVQNIGEIVNVEGVDAVLVGPYDLSASMGLAGQVTHPDVQTAITRVKNACQAVGKPAGVFTVAPADARTYMQAGFRLIATSSDTLLLVNGAQAAIKILRG